MGTSEPYCRFSHVSAVRIYGNREYRFWDAVRFQKYTIMGIPKKMEI